MAPILGLPLCNQHVKWTLMSLMPSGPETPAHFLAFQYVTQLLLEGLPWSVLPAPPTQECCWQNISSLVCFWLVCWMWHTNNHISSSSPPWFIGATWQTAACKMDTMLLWADCFLEWTIACATDPPSTDQWNFVLCKMFTAHLEGYSQDTTALQSTSTSREPQARRPQLITGSSTPNL